MITGATASIQQLQQRRDDCPDKTRNRSKESKQNQAPSSSLSMFFHLAISSWSHTSRNLDKTVIIWNTVQLLENVIITAGSYIL